MEVKAQESSLSSSGTHPLARPQWSVLGGWWLHGRGRELQYQPDRASRSPNLWSPPPRRGRTFCPAPGAPEPAHPPALQPPNTHHQGGGGGGERGEGEGGSLVLSSARLVACSSWRSALRPASVLARSLRSRSRACCIVSSWPSALLSCWSASACSSSTALRRCRAWSSERAWGWGGGRGAAVIQQAEEACPL